MKKILIIFLIGIFTVSCDFLDIVPDDTATLGDAFKNETTAENFIFTCYSYQRTYSDFRNQPGIMTSNEFVAAYHWTAEWFPFMRFAQSLDNSSSPIYDLWQSYYQGIKQCYIFLNNIDAVKPVNMSESIYATNKEQWIGEAYFLIAYYHHLLLQNYGPIVIMEGETVEKQPRLTYDECVEKIAALYDEAITRLADRMQPANYGRATKAVAKSFKAKLYLYAASPLFNGNTDYADFKDKEGNVLVNQTYSKEKWKTAMDAAKEAITFAEGLGYKLYEWEGNDPFTKAPVASTARQAYLNTRYMVVDVKNWTSELIWGYTIKESSDGWHRHVVPHGMADRPNNSSQPFGAISPSLAAAKIFYTANGLPPESDSSFPWNARMTVPSGENTCNLHLNREPRFYAAIGYDRGIYEFNGWGDTEYTLKLRCGNGANNSSLTGGGTNPEPNGCIGPSTRGNDHLYAGYAIKKTVHPGGEATSSAWSFQSYAWPLMRIADLYLMYIEACAEYNGSLDTDAKNYLTKIHARAGIPDKYHTATGDNLIKSVRRERMIELVFESQWHYDTRRWKIAKEWYANEKDGMYGLNEMGQTADDFYQEVPCRNQPYIFNDRNYLMPINSEYVNTNEKLVQNPGY